MKFSPMLASVALTLAVGCTPEGKLKPSVVPVVDKGVDALCAAAQLEVLVQIPCAAIEAIVNSILGGFEAAPGAAFADYNVTYRGKVVRKVRATSAQFNAIQAKVNAL
jgi:hypothetical protein